MRRFRFGLASVLHVRRVEEERAKRGLLEANVAARRTAAVVEARLHAYLAAPRPQARMSHDEFERARFALETAATSVESARVAHREALDRVDACRLAWMDAKQKVQALERLERRRRDEHAVALGRAEERLIDDLVVARHRIRTLGAAR